MSEQDANAAIDEAVKGQEPAPGEKGESSKVTFTDEQQKLIDKRIAQAIERGKQSAAAEAAEKAKNAALPELERKSKELEDATNKLTALQLQVRERDAKDSVAEAARKAGATDASPIWKMVKGDLEFNEDGSIKNLDTAIKDAKAIAPQLFKPVSGKADAGAGSTTTTKKADWMRAALDSR